MGDRIITDNSKVNTNLIAENAQLRAELNLQRDLKNRYGDRISWAVEKLSMLLECDEYTTLEGMIIGIKDKLAKAEQRVRELEMMPQSHRCEYDIFGRPRNQAEQWED